MKKKVLFIIDSLNSGGAEKSLISLLSMLDYNKMDVELLLFAKKGLFLSMLPKQVNLVLVKEKENKLTITHFFNRVKVAFAHRSSYVRRYHSSQINWTHKRGTIPNLEKKYDIAIAYSQGVPTYYLADKVNSKKKIGWINTDYKKAGYNKSFDDKFYKKLDHIITVSDLNRKIFIEMFPEYKSKTEVIYDIFSSDLVRKLAYQGNGFNDNFNGIKILTVGRLVEAKGYDLAIEACKILKKQGLDFKWYIIGEGPLESKLVKQIKKDGLQNHFVLLGTYSNPYPFINESNIYVQPSRFEGYGLAIAEARILKKPVVVTDFSTVHNQIRHRENGLIVKMNPLAIVNGINEILLNKELRKTLIQNNNPKTLCTESEIDRVLSLLN